MPIKTAPSVTLFTAAEHVILAKWLKIESAPEGAAIDPDAALSKVGLTDEPNVIYSREDAAVAHILLESVESRLPQWAAVYFSRKNGQRIELTRGYRDPDGKPLRKVSLVPRRLFTINWADSGPGYSWPIEYRLVWVPHYERWVVTASADSTDAFGYCDFALGSITSNETVEEAVGKLIRSDWRRQFDTYGQKRWAYLLDVGLINKEKAEQWADLVWGEG